MPEVRLCDKDAEIERIKQYCSARGCKYKYWSIYCKACEVSDIIDEFEGAQEVEAKPVRHGRWETIDPSFAHVYCSECGAAADKHLAKRYKGCPFCLCVMDATDTNVGGKGGDDNAGRK